MQPVALFDLDNTLVDRSGAFMRWAKGFAAERGLGEGGVRWLCEADDDGFARRDDLFAAARDRFGIDRTVEDLVGAYRARYPDFFAPDPAVLAALSTLRARGWRIAVVTNGPPSQRDKVHRAGLDPLVDACVISEEIGSAKPDRAIFVEAVRRCLDGEAGTSGEIWRDREIWMVGDTPEPDVLGGLGMGFRTVWMHRGRTWPTDQYAPDATVGSLPEAVDVLLGLADPLPPGAAEGDRAAGIGAEGSW